MPKYGWVITDIRKSGERNSYKIKGRVNGKGTYSYWVYDDEIKKAKKMPKSRGKLVKEYENDDWMSDTPRHRVNSRDKYELYCDLCERYGHTPCSYSEWKRD
jgi:hypothetical protein